MKRFIIALVLLPLFSVTVWSFTDPPCFPAGIPVATLQGEAALGDSRVAWDYIGIRDAAGQINQYFVDIESIRFAGNPATIDATSSSQIFSLIARAIVEDAIAQGYVECTPPSCPTIIIAQEACFTRSGTGAATTFSPCQTEGCCTREYQVCCPEGPEKPLISHVRTYGPPCEHPGCQSACNIDP